MDGHPHPHTMATGQCQHTSWLQVIRGREDCKLLCDGAFGRLSRALEDPDRQCPQVALFLGGELKDDALRYMFPTNNFFRRTTCAGVLQLRCERASSTHARPLYLADVDPALLSSLPHGSDLGRSNCHAQEFLPVNWPCGRMERFNDLIFAKLILQFVNFVCIFASDCGGFGEVVKRLRTWSEEGQFDRDGKVKPYVMIILDEPVTEAHSFDHLTFAKVEVGVLACNHNNSRLRFTNLKRKILQRIERSASDRVFKSMLLTATHQEALFTQAIRQFVCSSTATYKPITAARHGLEVEEELHEHLSSALKLSSRENIPLEVITALHASSILMDAYPRRMHSTLTSSLLRLN